VCGAAVRADSTQRPTKKEVPVLFATVYTARGAGSEEAAKRVQQIYSQWKPPAGLEIKAFYSFANGNGGIVISETASAAVILEAISPFVPYFEYKVIPIVEISEAVSIGQKVNAWRDSIS
jgi:hypothetical protein